MRRDLQVMVRMPVLRFPSQVAKPGSSARGCYEAIGPS
jgi:hypothetical protein